MAALSRLLILALAATLHAAEPLPERDKNAPADFQPDTNLFNVQPAPGETSPLDVDRAQAIFDRAKRKEERWQKLQRAGVVSQVEFERASRQTAEAAWKLELARVEHWKMEVEQQRARLAKGGTSPDTLETAETSLHNAERLAAEAGAFYKKRQLEIAQANLERQQRLLALGAGSKSLVQEAAAALAKLRESSP